MEQAISSDDSSEIQQAEDADERVEADEQTLKGTLKRLFELFGEDDDAWLEIEKSFTTEAGESHRIYFQGDENDADLILRSTPIKIKDYLDQKTTEFEGDDSKLQLIQNAKNKFDEIEVITRASVEPKDAKKITDEITELSGMILEIEGFTIADLPAPADYRPSGLGVKSMKGVFLSTETVSPTGRPSGTNPEWSYLQSRGITRNDFADRWVKMHLVSAKLGGPSAPLNWVPAPNTVNRGSQVESFEEAAKRLVDDESGSQPNVIWVEVSIDNFRAPSAANGNHSEFAETVTFKAGLYLPPEQGSTEWREEDGQRAFERVTVPEPPLGNTPSLTSSSGTALRNIAFPGIDANVLFSRTTMDRVKEARRDGGGDFKNIGDLISRLQKIQPNNQRWQDKVKSGGKFATDVDKLVKQQLLNF